jgi:hypothetical protein
MRVKTPRLPGIDPSVAFENEMKIMSSYIETAKTYSQLSLGALVLSVTFIEKVVGGSVYGNVSTLLIVAWLSWLASALAGAIYQYLAARFLEARGEDWELLVRSGHPQWFEWLADHPWPAYAVMLATFAVGSIAFAVAGVQGLAALK